METSVSTGLKWKPAQSVQTDQLHDHSASHVCYWQAYCDSSTPTYSKCSQLSQLLTKLLLTDELSYEIFTEVSPSYHTQCTFVDILRKARERQKRKQGLKTKLYFGGSKPI